MTLPPRELLMRMFEAAVAAVSPAVCVPPHLPPCPPGRTVVVGAGKAAAAMARAVEDRWAGPLEGLVVTRYGHGVPTRRIEVVEAAHPVPDEAGQRAAERMLIHQILVDRHGIALQAQLRLDEGAVGLARRLRRKHRCGHRRRWPGWRSLPVRAGGHPGGLCALAHQALVVDADGLAINPSEPVDLALCGPAFEQGPDGGLQMRFQDVHSRVPSLLSGR